MYTWVDSDDVTAIKIEKRVRLERIVSRPITFAPSAPDKIKFLINDLYAPISLPENGSLVSPRKFDDMVEKILRLSGGMYCFPMDAARVNIPRWRM
jgi:hypothetical protein